MIQYKHTYLDLYCMVTIGKKSGKRKKSCFGQKSKEQRLNCTRTRTVHGQVESRLRDQQSVGFL